MTTSLPVPVAASVSAEPAAEEPTKARRLKRGLTVAWALLVFNILEFNVQPTIVRIPHSAAKIVTQGALVAALVVIVRFNRRLEFRRSPFLLAATIMALVGLVGSIELATFHSNLRGLREVGFLAAIWLLTPWWRTGSVFMAKTHMRVCAVVVGSAVIGLVVAPSKTYISGRLEGSVWPIPSDSLAHFAAVAAGLSALLLLAGAIVRWKGVTVLIASVAVLLLTHTRTATVALAIGLVVAAVSLFSWKRRTRRIIFVAFMVAISLGIGYRSTVTSWMTRNQSTTQLQNLTGRTVVWSELENAPRTRSQVLFGTGLSTGGFNGLSIDNSWLTIYSEQGLIGDVLLGVTLLVLLLLAATRPRGPNRAIAFFLVIFCLASSFTETGLGYPSLYLLDLAVAAAMVVGPRRPTVEQADLASPVDWDTVS